MNIWITSAGRATECAACKGVIEYGEIVVRGKVYGRNEEGKGWSKMYSWHTRDRHGLCCWLEEGILKEQRRERTETRGRKSMELPVAQQRSRVLLLKRRASVVSRLKKEAGLPTDVRDYERMAALGKQLEDIKLEIESYGGVPESWQKK